MDTPTIIEHLADWLEITRENHPSFKLMNNKIDESLFPKGIITFEAEACDSNEQLKTVKEIVEDSWNKGKKNHLMIEGEGGIGKTVTLLSLPDRIAPRPVPAIYIPLHDIRGTGDEDLIERYIKTEVLEEDEELFRQLKILRRTKWEKGPVLLLLLDGFNELPSEVLRGSVSRDIERWANYPGVQIITSSRYDIHNYVSLQSDFSKIELQRIYKKKVCDYLDKVDMPIPTDAALLELITNPLLLTLYIKTETIRSQRASYFARFKETKNAGTLIWNYLQCELWRFRNDRIEDAKPSILAMEFIAPYIAWKMQQQSCFGLDESKFNELLNEAHALLEAHIANPSELPMHIGIILQQSNEIPSRSRLSLLLKEQLGIFVGFKEKDENGNDVVRYKLMHQQFRDALAAIHLINSIYLNGNSRPTEWNSIVDHYVMQFVADLISEKEANRLWEQNRTSPQLGSATRNQIELQRRLHKCDFSKLDFSGLDLSNISLYPYRVGNTMLKLPTDADATKDMKISEKTFSPEGHSNFVTAVAVTSDGKRIVSGSWDNTLRIWDLETGACLKTLEGHTDYVTAVDVTSDGKRIISGSWKVIRVWDFETRACIKTLGGHEDWVTAMTFTSDCKRIVSGSWDNTIRVWDFETGSCLKTLEGHTASVNAVAVTSDGKRIVSGSWDGFIRVWDLQTGSCLKILKEHTGFVTAVAVTSDGKRIVSGSSDCTIRVWDLETGACLKTLKGHTNGVTAVAVTSDDKRIVSGSNYPTIRVWDLETGSCLKTMERHTDGVTTVAVTSDCKRIVSGSKDNTIRVWDLETGACLRTMEGHEKRETAVAVVSDDKHIVSGSKDNTIRVWDLETRACIKTMEGHESIVTAVAMTADGKRIVSGSWDKTIRVWDLETGACLKTLEGHMDFVTAVAVTAKGKRIVSGSKDNTIRVWDLETGVCLKTLEGHTNGVTAMAVTSNGKRIVSGSRGDTIRVRNATLAFQKIQESEPRGDTIRVWDLETGACLKTLEGHTNSVTAVAVTADDKRIVSGSHDHTIRVWDLVTGACLKTLIGHESSVTAVAVTVDGKRIVSGSGGGTIRVWDLETGECLITLEGHTDSVTAVAVTSDGKRIVSGSLDNTISIWDSESGKCLTAIRIHPLSFVGLDFSTADTTDISDELKEQLRQNGAKV